MFIIQITSNQTYEIEHRSSHKCVLASRRDLYERACSIMGRYTIVLYFWELEVNHCATCMGMASDGWSGMQHVDECTGCRRQTSGRTYRASPNGAACGARARAHRILITPSRLTLQSIPNKSSHNSSMFWAIVRVILEASSPLNWFFYDINYEILLISFASTRK